MKYYVVKLGYQEFAFTDKKDAILAWEVMSNAIKVEQSWKIDKYILDEYIVPKLVTAEALTVEQANVLIAEYDAAKAKVNENS